MNHAPYKLLQKLILLLIFMFSIHYSVAQRKIKNADELFLEVEQLVDSASRAEAPTYAPATFEKLLKTYERAVSLKDDNDTKEIQTLLKEAKELVYISFKKTDFALNNLDTLIKNRNVASSCEWLNSRSEEFLKAEEGFQEAIRQLEQDNSAQAKEIASVANLGYQNAVSNAFIKGPLEEIRQQLLLSKRQMSDDAYQQSLNQIQTLEKEIQSNRNQVFYISLFLEKWWERFGDIVVIPPGPALPDTLMIGAYTIVMEKYERKGWYRYGEGIQKSVTGYGRIEFDCEGQSTFIIPPYLFWEGLELKAYQFIVVDSTRNPEKEVTLEEARCLYPNTQRGEYVFIPLPVSAKDVSKSYSRREWLDELIDWTLFPVRKGIRVRFEDADIDPHISANKGRIVKGMAKYPTHPPITNIPTPPATLDLDGFTLELDSILLSTNKGEAIGRLILPSSIKDRIHCSPPKLELGKFRLTPFCEFYKVIPDSTYGPMTIGETPLIIEGNGYVVDFSPFQKYPPQGENYSWEGVILIKGKTLPKPTDSVIANDGYLKAPYNFELATIQKDGFNGKLAFDSSLGTYRFHMLQPYGYRLSFTDAELQLVDSKLSGGKLDKGTIFCPITAVRRDDHSPVEASFQSLEVQADHDLLGRVELAGEINWGEWYNKDIERAFYRTELENPLQGVTYFSGKIAPTYFPLNGNNFQSPLGLITSINDLETIHLQGILFANFNNLTIYTQHTPGAVPIEFKPFPGRFVTWMNIASKGVHSEVFTFLEEEGSLDTGPVGDPQYVDDDPIHIVWGEIYQRDSINTPTYDNPTHGFNNIAGAKRSQGYSIPKNPGGHCFLLRFVESAVFDGDFKALVDLPYPIDGLMPFKKMMTSSIADITGGKPTLTTPLEMAHWGVELEQTNGFSSAGIISTRTGQIVMTAAGITEKRHFSRPFQLTWGELLPDGNLGRLFFNYHTGGQTFDGFNYVTTAVRLSPYEQPDDLHSAYVVTEEMQEKISPHYQITDAALSAMSTDGVPVNIRNTLNTSTLKDQVIKRQWRFRGSVKNTLRNAGIDSAAIDDNYGAIQSASQIKPPLLNNEGVIFELEKLKNRKPLIIGKQTFEDEVKGAVGNDGWNMFSSTILNEVALGGYLEVGGRTHFPFYGGEYHHINDFHYPGTGDHSLNPYNNRFVSLADTGTTNFQPTDHEIYANWVDGVGKFSYTIDYDSPTQDGFSGPGFADFRNLTGGSIESEVSLNSRGICMSVLPPPTAFRGVSLGPVANLSSLTNIWGCACLEQNGQLKRAVVGGEVAAAGNFSILARSGFGLSATLEVTPSTSQLTMDGVAYLSLGANVDLEADGHLRLLQDTDNNFTEGDVAGHFRMVAAPGIPTFASGVEGDGQLNWHLGGPSADPYQLVQGKLSLQVLGIFKAGASSGFFLGIKAPKEKAWVLKADNSLYALNTGDMPDKLTGFYGYMQHSKEIDIGILSGGTEMFVGVGGFIDIGTSNGQPSGTGLPFVVGNLGGRIYGDILWGFVSASAGYNLQAKAPYPAAFQGKVKLRGCVLWVACKSINLTVGANTSEGFYIY